jgi:DNA-binding GntR family transcriptional regulator
MAKAQPAPSKTQAVYDYILEHIISGHFPAGSGLHIGQLAEQTGVSLIPVREALRRLEADGVVKVEHHRGAKVASLTQRDYEEIMEAQAVIEGVATAMSAPHLSAEELQLARTYNAEMDAASDRGDMHGYHESSLKFHELLHSHCPNTYLIDALTKSNFRVGAVQAARIGFTTDITKRLSDDHLEILEMIANRAPANEIELFAREHRLRTMARLADAGNASQNAAHTPDEN